MTSLPRIASRVFDTPLLMARAKLETIMGVLMPRFQGASLPPATSSDSGDSQTTSDGIAIIPVFGTLVQRATGLEAQSGLTSYASVAEQFKSALQDVRVKGIVLDIDSPGGEASGVFDLAAQIYAARKTKPIYAVADEEAFSAAYAIAAAASKIFIPRTGGVGSIGVIAVHLDQSKADEQDGLQYTAIYAGARKNDLSPHEPLSDPARQMLQAEVDRVYEVFVSDVAQMRGLSTDAVKAMEARLYFSQDAVKAGLADETGTLNDALGAMAKSLNRTAIPRPLRQLKPKEKVMSDAHESPDVQTAPAETPDTKAEIAAAKTTATAETLAYAAEVTELCRLAGVPGSATEFIAKATPIAEVRKALLTARAAADEASVIAGQIPANTNTQQGEPKIDTAAIYANRNSKKEQ
jgi:signal peptide peptidase SppA